MTLTDLPPTLVTPTMIDVPLGRGRTVALSVDERSVAIGRRHVALEDVRTVAYGTHTGSLNLVQRRVERHVRLTDDAGEIELALGVHAFGARNEFVHHQAYGAITTAIHAIVEPRLRAEILRTIASGAQVQIGDLWLDHDGIRSRSRAEDTPIAWAHLPVAEFQRRLVAITATIDRADTVTWTVPMLTPNAVLLPELLIDAADAFA